MSRLPCLRRDELTPGGQAWWDVIAGIPGVGALARQGPAGAASASTDVA